MRYHEPVIFGPMDDDDLTLKSCENCFYEKDDECTNKKDCDDFSGWKPKNDMVNNPKHYTQGKIEVIEVIEDWKLNYCEGNVIKYVARYKYKNGLEDLKKAEFYIKRLIASYDNNN